MIVGSPNRILRGEIDSECGLPRTRVSSRRVACNFDPATDRVPTSIPDVVITLTATDAGNHARFAFVVLDADDNRIEERVGDLIPHLTAAQKTAANNFVNAMLVKARSTPP